MWRGTNAADRAGAGGDQAGFTLIEVMIAMVVFSLGLFAVIQLQVVAVRGNAYARERTEAYEIALGVAEEMRLQSLRWKPLTTFEDQMYGVPGTLPAPSAPPADGDDIPAAQLQPYPIYHDTVIGGGAFDTALGVNILSETGAPRSTYRVHYVMYWVRPSAGALASQSLVRVTVLVSWDNKDHGLQTGSWDDPLLEKFWDRHMVAITFYLAQVL